MIHAFTDGNGGHYQVDVPDGAALPEWVNGLTPTAVVEPTAALPTPADQIAVLEREHMLPKATRKFMLSYMEATAIQQGAGQGLTPEQSLEALTAGNPGYAAVKALDDQIEALEGLL